MKKMDFSVSLIVIFILTVMSLSAENAVSSDSESVKMEISEGISTKDKVKLDSVVVTATKTERKEGDVPGRVQVISGDRLIRNTGKKLDEMLSEISGLSITRETGVYHQNPDVILRGLGGQEQGRTLVLIDGVPVNKSDTGGVLWNRIDTGNIQRVEVFKGPGSSLYGNNAMGGVINIITKKPGKGMQARVTGGYSSFNTHNAGFSVSSYSSDIIKGLYFNFSGFYLDSDGCISVQDSAVTDETIKEYAEELNLSAKAGYDINRKNNVEVSYSYYDDKRGDGIKLNSDEAHDDGQYKEFNTHFTSLKYSGYSGKFKWEAASFFQNENFLANREKWKGSLPSFQRIYVDSSRKDYGVMLNGSAEIYKNILSLGLDFKEGRVNAVDDDQLNDEKAKNEGKIQLYAIYIQDELSLLDEKLNILAGVRLDFARFYDGFFQNDNSLFDSFNGHLDGKKWWHLSPRVSARYNFTDDYSIYTSYSRGFRASILDDLCRSGWMWGRMKQANPDLEPEKIDTFELGGDMVPVKRIKISATGFFSLGRDFLYYIDTGADTTGPPVRDIYRRENVGEVRIFGAEMDTRIRIIKGLSVYANYTYNNSKIHRFSERKELEGEFLTYVPQHQANSGLEWLNPYVNTSFSVHFKSEQFTDDENNSRIDDYYTLDIKAWAKVFDHLTVSGGINNLLDERHITRDDSLSLGRVFTVEASAEF